MVLSIGKPAIRHLCRREDQFVDLLQRVGLDLGLEVGRCGKLVLQRLAEQMLHRAGQVGGRGGLWHEAGPERHVVLVQVQVVRRIERSLRQRIQPVGRIQMVLHPLTQLAALALQHGLGGLAILGR
jgi:hypothetical protein